MVNIGEIHCTTGPFTRQTVTNGGFKRLESQLSLFDVVRIDHFRGFHDYWSIPADTSDAKAGKWENGPGIDFWNVVAK